MSGIKVELKNSGIAEKSILEYKQQVENIHKDLHKRSNDEKDFVGWLELPTNYDKEEFKRIKKAAKKIKKESDILVVIGIGGSYLGARAVIESIKHTFYNFLSKEQRKTPQILYVGNNLSPNYINDIIQISYICCFDYLSYAWRKEATWWADGTNHTRRTFTSKPMTGSQVCWPLARAKRRRWPLGRTEIRFSPSAPTRGIGNTQNISLSTSRKTIQSVPR